MRNEEAITELSVLWERMKRAKESGVKTIMYYDGQYVEALDLAIKALEQEPCEDCISRDDAIELIAGVDKTDGNEPVFSGKQIIKMLKSLPSVTPQRPKGKWIQTKDDCDGVNFYDFSFECIACGKEQSFKSNYCPYCGARMEVDK